MAVATLAGDARAQALVNDPAADTTAQDTQSGTALAVVPPTTVLAVFNDSGSFVGTPQQHFTGYARSTDGGQSFADLGRLPDTANGDVGYPVLARNASNGRIFLATLGFASQAVIPVFRSDDGGATWQGPATAFNTGVMDRHWIAVDNAPGVGQGLVYLFARDFGTGGGMRLARSSDNGVTFSNVQSFTSNGTLANVTVGPDHTLYVFWLEGTLLRVRVSGDFGATLTLPVTVATIASTGQLGDLGIGFRTAALPQAVATATPGTVVVAWADRGTAMGDRADVFHVVSTDFGATWSAPARVNDDATTRDQAVPTIAITADRTRLAIGWYDRRNDPANVLLEYRVRVATVAGGNVAFAPSIPVSGGSFPPVRGQDPIVNANYFVDYDQATADDAFFYFAWADTRLASATHAQQPDVRLARVAAPPAPPLFADGFE
jgi:hypothetical protein